MHGLEKLSQNLKIRQKGLLLVCIPLVCQLVFVGVLTWLLAQAERETLKESQAKILIAQVHQLNSMFLEEAKTASLYAVTRNVELSHRIDKLQRQAQEQTKLLYRMSHTQKQKDLLLQIEQLSTKRHGLVVELRKILDQGARESIFIRNTDILQEIGYLIAQIGGKLDQFVQIEKESEEAQLAAARAARQRTKEMIVFLVVFNMLLALSLNRYFDRTTSERLSQVMRNTDLLIERKALNPVVAGKDEIAELDRVFHRMADRLAEVEKIKREFFAMVSHDLRTPLTTLRMFIGLLPGGIYGELNEGGRERATGMERTVARMITLINDLLDIEKLDQGKLDVNIQAIELRDVINHAIESVGNFAENKDLTVEVAPTNLRILGDADRLVQVLVNLLSNAIKFSPEGGAIKVGVEESPPLKVKVSVSDQGPGIPAKDRGAIFERFKQLDTPGADKRASTGLGLPICKSIIELHNGEIGVESAVGKGSTFWFVIPLAPQGKG